MNDEYANRARYIHHSSFIIHRSSFIVHPSSFRRAAIPRPLPAGPGWTAALASARAGRTLPDFPVDPRFPQIPGGCGPARRSPTRCRPTPPHGPAMIARRRPESRRPPTSRNPSNGYSAAIRPADRRRRRPEAVRHGARKDAAFGAEDDFARRTVGRPHAAGKERPRVAHRKLSQV